MENQKSILMTQALQAVASHAQDRAHQLSQAKHQTMRAWDTFARQLPLAGVEAAEDPAYPVAALVSQTMTTVRDDGFPAISLPEDTAKIVYAAMQAGMVGERIGQLAMDYVHTPYATPNGICWVDTPQFDAYYDAWKAEKDYVKAQTYHKI